MSPLALICGGLATPQVAANGSSTHIDVNDQAMTIINKYCRLSCYCASTRGEGLLWRKTLYSWITFLTKLGDLYFPNAFTVAGTVRCSTYTSIILCLLLFHSSGMTSIGYLGGKEFLRPFVCNVYRLVINRWDSVLL